MALVKCKECGEQISTNAKACPKCGAEVSKKKSGCLTAILVFLIILIIGSVFDEQKTSSSSSTQKKSQTSNASIQNKEPEKKEPEKPKTLWTNTISKDEMTGKKSAYAVSVTISPTKKMGFPYHDTEAWLGVGCSNKDEWAYVGFSNSPNLSDTETEDGYNVINTRIKWGNNVENTSLTQKWGASFLHFSNDSSVITKIMSSSSVLLELQWHGEQKTYFEFPLFGSSEAIKSMRAECAK